MNEVELTPPEQWIDLNERQNFALKETAVRLWDKNWMQIEEYLRHDNRVVVPIGSTEQHGYLSLGTDALLAERVSIEAAEPLGVPVLPVIPFGMAPYFTSYPGSMSLRLSTYIELLRDVLNCLEGQGFRRIAVINGHGGNIPIGGLFREWICQPRAEEVQVLFHSWYNGPQTVVAANEFHADQMHGAWVENFPWTRIEGADAPPPKPVVARELLMNLGPEAIRELAPDGAMGGPYEAPDEIMDKVWAAGVQEVRTIIESGWVQH